MIHGRVLAHPADIGGIFADALDGGDVATVLALVEEHDAGRLTQDALGFLDRNRPFEFDVDRFGMADEHRHAHAGGGDEDVGGQDLVGLLRHLQLFLGVTVIARIGADEAVDVRNDVEGDLLGKFARRERIADEDGAAFFEQFVHAFLAGARNRLIGRHDDAADAGGIVQRLERHHHLRRRTIRVGDDVALFIAVDGFGVHLGHDQRHIGFHAEQAGVVDDGAAGGGGFGGIDFGGARAGGEQRHVPARKIEMLDVVDLQLAAGIAEIDDVAGRTRRCHRGDIGEREFALGQDVEHFAPDIAGRADDDDFITHDHLLIGSRLVPPRKLAALTPPWPGFQASAASP